MGDSLFNGAFFHLLPGKKKANSSIFQTFSHATENANDYDFGFCSRTFQIIMKNLNGNFGDR